jgi:hypothetical protein
MRRTNPRGLVSPSRNTPSAGSNTIRWQVSRLAEQDFSFDPHLPDPLGSVASEDLSGHGRGGGCFKGSSP